MVTVNYIRKTKPSARYVHGHMTTNTGWIRFSPTESQLVEHGTG